MDQKGIPKLLFKKLSALRATLSDEEQWLLDSLLLGEHKVSDDNPAASRPAPDGKPTVTCEEDPAHFPRMNGSDFTETVLSIQINEESETYIVS